MLSPVSLAAAGAAFPFHSPSDIDPYGSKIGGIAAWFKPEHATKETLKCPSCRNQLVLIIQAYAPDDGPRSLLLFGCPKHDCITQPGSWRCFRTQLPCDATADVDTPKHTTSGSGKAVSGWDEGTGDDIDGEAGGWGSAGDWGDAVTEPSTTEPTAVSFGGDIDISASFASLSVSGSASTATDVIGVEKAEFGLHPVALEWFDEPTGHDDRLSTKAQALLERFLTEGEEEDVAEYRTSVAPTAGGGSSNHALEHGEGYEKLSATQKCTIKFQETVAQAPSQIIRYAFDGEPLWPTPAPTDRYLRATIPRCSVCGSVRVFEAQILPSIINYFRPSAVLASEGGVTQDEIEDLDWDVVLIFSCPNSCGDCGEEAVFVR